MAYAHVAHDCHVGSHTIFGNAATLGGHVTVEDYATISAYSGVHQFCRVGQHAFIGGYTVVTRDALPYAKTVGNRARIYGVNAIGLARRGFSPELIEQLRKSQTAIFDHLTREEIRFARTVEAGTAHLQNLLDKLRDSEMSALNGVERTGILDGHRAFDLYATYGLPFEIQRDIAREQGLDVDEAGFNVAKEEHSKASGEHEPDGELARSRSFTNPWWSIRDEPPCIESDAYREHRYDGELKSEADPD